LNKLADSSGLPRASVTSALTFLLPRLFAQLTPGGLLPSGATVKSQRDEFMHRPAGLVDVVRATHELPAWLPWAALALIAFTGLFFLGAG
jgi:hypothetical protein